MRMLNYGRLPKLFFLASLLCGLLPIARAQITIAAAADLGPALSEVTNLYKNQTRQEAKVSLGASGNLTQQIKNGAPFDIFLSADEEYPKQLIDAGFAERPLHRYAVGKLVLWLPADSPLDPTHGGLNVLTDPSVKKIAIANPLHAPYGRAAVAALKHSGLYEKVEPTLVLGENVAQAAQFVESGNAQAGLVALSHALAPGMKDKGRYWEVPADGYPELDQGAVVLSHSTHKKEAAAFLQFLTTEQVRALLQHYGFSTPRDQH